MAGLDSNVKLLLHCDGEDASTSFPDASDSAHIVTAIDNAQVDTAQKKFNTGSALFDGSGDYLSIPVSPDWDFGTYDMAIDGWVRFNSLSGSQAIICRFTSTSGYLYWALEGGAIRFRDFGGSIDFSRSPSLSVDTWYHFAITRSGSDFRFFVNGVQQGATYVNSGAFVDRSVALFIGSMPHYAYHFNGWIRE